MRLCEKDNSQSYDDQTVQIKLWDPSIAVIQEIPGLNADL